MATLSWAWRNSGGHVLGLAPTADAAILLGEGLGAPTDTLDKYVWSTDPSATTPRPDWFTRVGPDTLIVVDEAGKASTAGLDTLITDALAKGASIRLVGDDGQLSSISAGGILRDIAEATDALTLTEVVRFRDPAEAAAGLALHDADPAGIGFYLDHHRIHVGTDETAADMAYQAWRTDLADGVDSILLAPTHDVINALNARARSDRLATHPNTADTPTVMLGDGLRPASVTRSAAAATPAHCASAATISSATATASPSPTSAPTGLSPRGICAAATASSCRAPTSPSTSVWGMPPPSTLPKA